MQTIPFHIAYLLIHHECVIVPGLGAFLASSSDRKKTTYQGGILSPPKVLLGFNPEIKHNDGLLANSIAKDKKFSFREANLLIDQYVGYVLHSLDEGKEVHIFGVGTLYSKDNKRLFKSYRNLSCNALNFGLTSFSFPRLNDLQQKTTVFPEKKNKEIVWIPISRKFIFYCGSVAAAFIAMCIIPTPLNNGRVATSATHTQYASIIDLPRQNALNEETNTVSEREIQLPADSSLVDSSLTHAKTELQPRETVMHPKKTITSHYYIIVASLPNQAMAKKTLTKLQSKFEKATILYSDGRYRIYTDRFDDRAKAELFLIRFRKNNPELDDAWLLPRRD